LNFYIHHTFEKKQDFFDKNNQQYHDLILLYFLNIQQIEVRHQLLEENL
jgi:hypothetical protein